ncbi:protein of unknown function [Bradyrhizobium vignae]|uniref:Uncharacterized protein n=1 Tax=Bradyrhizobium vignae TaxID=1549949 RepID=A0A2U3Q733_9BRAD|nr:protein of unknown function [Bradyrhizobium vignae]
MAVFEALTSLLLPIDWVTGSSRSHHRRADRGGARVTIVWNLRSYWHAPSNPADVPHAGGHAFAFRRAICRKPHTRPERHLQRAANLKRHAIRMSRHRALGIVSA